jgi:hypothetical protein
VPARQRQTDPNVAESLVQEDQPRTVAIRYQFAADHGRRSVSGVPAKFQQSWRLPGQNAPGHWPRPVDEQFIATADMGLDPGLAEPIV